MAEEICIRELRAEGGKGGASTIRAPIATERATELGVAAYCTGAARFSTATLWTRAYNKPTRARPRTAPGTRRPPRGAKAVDRPPQQGEGTRAGPREPERGERGGPRPPFFCQGESEVHNQ